MLTCCTELWKWGTNSSHSQSSAKQAYLNFFLLSYFWLTINFTKKEGLFLVYFQSCRQDNIKTSYVRTNCAQALLYRINYQLESKLIHFLDLELPNENSLKGAGPICLQHRPTDQ